MVILIFNFLDQTLNVLGYFRKKNRGVGDILFWKPPVEYFIFLPLELPGKTKLHSWKFYKIVLDSLKIPRPKTKSTGNSTQFFLGRPWKFQFVFNQLLEISHALFLIPQEIPYPLSQCFFFFFWNCPLNTQVICIGCLRCQWHTGELFYYQWPRFDHLIWEGLKFFFNKLFWLTTKRFSDF